MASDTKTLPPIVEGQPLPIEYWPDVENLVTEDNAPVDNIFSAKQARLLIESLYSSWAPVDRRPFLADTNVGLFYVVGKPPIVPDFFLSLGVEAPKDWWPKIQRSYFLWYIGKPPELVLEVVSNQEGEENSRKKEIYANIGVPYYVVWDPSNELDIGLIKAYVNHAGSYEPLPELWFPKLDLGLTVWQGEYEKGHADWLRWCDRQGNLIPTGADQRLRADQEKLRAELEKSKAEEANRRAEQLAAQLRALGIEPTKE